MGNKQKDYMDISAKVADYLIENGDVVSPILLFNDSKTSILVEHALDFVFSGEINHIDEIKKRYLNDVFYGLINTSLIKQYSDKK